MIFHFPVLAPLQTNWEYHYSYVLLRGLRSDFLGGWREKREVMDAPALVKHSRLGAAGCPTIPPSPPTRPLLSTGMARRSGVASNKISVRIYWCSFASLQGLHWPSFKAGHLCSVDSHGTSQQNRFEQGKPRMSA